MYWLLLIIATLVWIIFLVLDKPALTFTAFIALLGFFVAALEHTSWAEESHRKKADEDRREAIPHIIREADGCKVYAFKTDREHYFTRCGSTVSTETNYTVTCGKNCRREESDVIATQEGNL